MSLADDDFVDDADRSAGLTPAAARAAAIAKLVAAVQTRPGHVVVIGKDAKAAAGLFDEAEAHLATYRGVRVRGRALDGDAAVAALCADKEQGGSPGAWQRAAMQALVEEARTAALPVVVVVAEADAVDAGRLERFRQAVECVTDASEVVRMVLLGGPRLMHTVRRHEARSLTTRVAAVVRVPAMAAPEGRAFGRLARALAGYTPAAALGGMVVLATWMLAPMILAPREPVAGPPPTPLVTDPQGPLVLAPLLTTSEAPEAAPAAAPTPTSLPVPKPVASPPPTLAPVRSPRPAQGPALQVGAFLSAASAEALRQRLTPQFGAAYVSTVDRNGSTYHRVRLAGFASEADLRAAETALRKAGYAPVRARD